MLVILIPWTIIAVCVVILVSIAIKKIPYLRAVDVASLPKVKVQELKKSLVAQRLERVGKRWGKMLSVWLAPLARVTRSGISMLKARVAAWEEKYQRLKRESAVPESMGPEALKKLIAEAERLMKEERFGEAEKKFIELLSHDPKNLAVYEDLGALYMRTKNFDQAEETFKFILKTHSQDASVLTSLGEIELARGKPQEAATYFGRAVKKRPNNPKYLDFLIEASIQGGEFAEAERALAKLRTSNPENQKLADFEQRILTASAAGKKSLDKRKPSG